MTTVFPEAIGASSPDCDIVATDGSEEENDRFVTLSETSAPAASLNETARDADASPTYISYLPSCFLTCSSRLVNATEFAANSHTDTRHTRETLPHTAETSTGSSVTFNALRPP